MATNNSQNNNNQENEITPFAMTNFRNINRKFGIKSDDRRRHMYIIGKTGMGKSTTIENMIVDDIHRGKGVALIDPLGDLVERVIQFIPSHRINDVVYFNPADLDYPIAFNVLESVDPTYHHLVTSGLIAVFKKIWIDSWGPRLEYLLRNTILSLLEYPGSTLLGVTRLLVDKNYRKKVVDKITDPVVKAFWKNEYQAYSNQFRTEAISPIQNKVGQFLSSSVIRNIVGQPKSTIDMREIMDEGKILLLNLSKGRVGEDNSSLLGAMMVTKIQLAAMSRIDVPEEERKDFYLYVDEFQNFATESFATILSEARKYRLDLTIAHQYIEQLDEKVQAAVFGNVGTIVAFRVGAADAEFLVKEFEPIFSETDLVNLTKYEVYLKLMIDGVASDPFSASTLPPVTEEEGNREKIIRTSRERYSEKREIIEDKISRWTGAKSEAQKSQSNNQTNRNYNKNYNKNRRYNKKDNKPKVDFRKEKIVPQASIDNKKAISLKEALGKEPTSFKQSKRRKAKQRKSSHQDNKNYSSKENKKSTRSQNKNYHSLNPGQVVKM
ncbi:MAG: type IV secretion system DNA-binding domain-containing protein [Patescibacteria group bacterium]|nr:type IV secretion system DNA-binding domain-containing protein [Patescibacteria group bacterium]